MKSFSKPDRSLLKAVTWRIIGSLDTMFVSFLVTRHWKLALAIGSVEVFTKMVLYYFHERVWNRINVGRPAECRECK